MKQKALLSLMAASLLASASAQAEEFTVDGINYEIEDGVVWVSYNYDFEGEELVIPPYVTFEGTEYPVTAVGDYAFNYNTSITSVTFPETVTRIGMQAFADCSELKSVVLPDNITALGEWAFGWSGMEEVTLSKNLTEIGMGAFNYAPNLRSVVIPEGITYIGEQMFAACPLESLDLPEGIEVIGNYSFADCYYIPELHLPSTVKRIEEQAFTRCNFHDVTIPGSVEYIGYYGLGQIGEYQEIGKLTLEDSDTPLELDSYAFSGTYFTDYYQGRDLSHAIDFDTMYLQKLTTGGGCKKIEGFSITYDSLTEVNLHEGLEEIGQDFLSINYGLKKLVIPSSVNIIGQGAMSIMQELDELRFEDSDVPLEIRDYAMGICDPVSLYWGREIANPEVWLSLGGSRMEYLTLGGGCKTVTRAWSQKSALKEVVLKEGVERIEDQGLSNSWQLEKVTLPSTLTYIGKEAFDYDDNLAECVIPESVEYIGDSAFKRTKIGDQTFGPNLSYLGGWSFANCENITNITLPENLETINWCAFMETGLTEVTIPGGVKFIDTAAFGDCPNLTKITLQDNEDGIYLSSMGVFIGSPVQELYVGRQVHGSHFTKDNLTKLTLTGGCTKIWGYDNAPVLQDITLGPNTASIESEAFTGCDAIQAIFTEALVPPVLEYDAFDPTIYDTAYLYVPEGTLEAYAGAMSWEDFVNINLSTGIDAVAGEADSDTFRVYTIDGITVNAAATADDLKALPSGLYIINGRKVRK